MVIVMVLGFSGLIYITTLSYQNAPPIPARVVDAKGAAVFSGEEISEGQTVFLRYGLMANGSIWGHGAYLGSLLRHRQRHIGRKFCIGRDTSTNRQRMVG